MNDFESRNPEIAEVIPEMVLIATVLNQQSHLLMDIRTDMGKMVCKRDADRLQLTSQQVEISRLQGNISRLQEDNAVLHENLWNANNKLAVIRTPPPTSSSSRMHERDDILDSRDTSNKSPRLNSTVGSSTSVSAALPVRHRNPISNESAVSSTENDPSQVANESVAQRLMYGNESREVSETTSNKNLQIGSMVEELYAAGHLKAGSWNRIPNPRKYKEKQLFKNVLELCEYVADDDEKRALRTNNLSKEDLKRHANSIQRKSMRMLWEFEGLDADDQENAQKKKNPSQRQKPTYLAMGGRVRAYKQYLAKASGNTTNAYDEKLRPRPPIADPGTPEDTRSIRTLLGAAAGRGSSGTHNPT
jgi:hypothetical protein